MTPFETAGVCCAAHGSAISLLKSQIPQHLLVRGGSAGIRLDSHVDPLPLTWVAVKELKLSYHNGI